MLLDVVAFLRRTFECKICSFLSKFLEMKKKKKFPCPCGFLWRVFFGNGWPTTFVLPQEAYHISPKSCRKRRAEVRPLFQRATMDVFDTMNTEQSVSRAIVGDWLSEMDAEMDKLICPWMVTPRLKVILTRVACKVHGKEKSPGKPIFLPFTTTMPALRIFTHIRLIFRLTFPKLKQTKTKLEQNVPQTQGNFIKNSRIYIVKSSFY